ncbi:hypothetical protein PTTG_27699 [Puccinia triticina 1-1 BBBD Race 1]|uniref:SNF2_N domain-containing protein n=1 Tax=Puccinia triticina (isolate 1-1 / race 1 (BBBD)) TaxID=630390 RepID=A0A180GHP8_PUCT1|nr:hypothetical protein PTTG_27699 [Puccinia triticina 1-1 BBBD Race 1]
MNPIPEQNTQRENPTDLECLGTISGNCVMVDGLRKSIKYASQTRALLQKGANSINVFTWPGAQAGLVAEPLSGVLRKLLVGPIGTVSTELNAFLSRKTDNQSLPGTSLPTVIMDSTLLASPTPTPTLKVILMLFVASGHTPEVLKIFEESGLKVKIIKGYRPENCSGIPHSLHLEVGQRLALAKPIHGCKTALLTHQQQALEFILELESPESSALSAFWNSSTCAWLKQLFDHSANTGKTKCYINHKNQGSILANDMGLGKTLTSLALIVTLKDAAELFANTNERHLKATLVVCPLSTLANWEAEIYKHLDPTLVDQSQYDLPKQQTSWHDSPKIVHLIGDLKAHLRSEQGGQIAKAVVFSQWTHFLGIVGVALVKNGIDFEQIDGTCSLQQREKALARIWQQSNVQVLLATVGACGVEINLTCTQKVYLMEPCWNPSVESQATDWAYRLGQVCTTRIIRYFIEGSIEVNMIEIQKRKKELAQ